MLSANDGAAGLSVFAKPRARVFWAVGDCHRRSLHLLVKVC